VNPPLTGGRALRDDHGVSARRSRLSLRVRLTGAFAGVIALVLIAVGVVIYVEFRRSVDSRTDDELAERAVAFRGLATNEVRPRRIVELSGEAYAQIYDPYNNLLATSRTQGRKRLVTAAQLQSARRSPVLATQASAAGTSDGVRLRAFRIDEDNVAVIAEPLDSRERELHRLATLLLIGLPAALLLSSLTGYQVAGAALRPVERIRLRAAQIQDTNLDERLPRPGTGDELDRLTETLNTMLDRLQRALEHERRIVGDASHELRTPIAVLRTRVDVALRDPSLNSDELRATLGDVRGDTIRLSRLADDLLLLARADQGQLPLRPEPLDVQEILERAAERHRADIEAAGRSIAVAVHVDGGAVVLGDDDRIGQVFDNLIVNSLRYGDGPIDLVAEASPDPGAVRLAVADHGRGFPDGFAARAFDRFSQGTDEAGQQGSGLGLAIVSAIVLAHGGTVTIDTDVTGSRIVMELPLA
jgi:two-component system, OmpR family, sensor kinase